LREGGMEGERERVKGRHLSCSLSCLRQRRWNVSKGKGGREGEEEKK